MPVSAPTPKQEATKTTTMPARLRELAEISPELAKLVAKNPSAAPDLLRELGSHSDAAIRKKVAGNPNTPAEVLLKLAGQFPEQLLDNPIFDLLLLENPDFLTQLSESALRSLLKRDKFPISFLEWAAEHRNHDVQMAIAMNPSTPQSILEKLSKHHSYHPQVFEAARLHVNLAGEIDQGWDDIARTGMLNAQFEHNQEYEAQLVNMGAVPIFLIPALSTKARRVAAWNPNTSPEILLELMNDLDVGVRYGVDWNPNTPQDLLQNFWGQLQAAENLETLPDYLDELANSEWWLVRLRVANHPKTPGNVLAKLSKERYEKVRQTVANNPNTSTNTLEKFAETWNASIWEALAKNPNTPETFLKKVLQEENRFPEIRRAIALNPKISRDILEQLAQDKQEYVREAVAKNPHTPTHVLKNLSEDQGFQVAASVARNPSISESFLEQLSKHENRLIRSSVAGNPNTPSTILQELAEDPDKWVLCSLVANPNTPLSILEKELKKDHIDQSVLEHLGTNPNLREDLVSQLWQHLQKYQYTRLCVACNAKTHEKLLQFLATDKNKDIREAVAENLNTPEDLAIPLWQTIMIKEVSKASARELKDFAKASTPSFCRLIVFLHPQAPVELLAKNVRSLNWLERYAIARNPNTPPSTLKILANDGNRVVRAAARATILVPP